MKLYKLTNASGIAGAIINFAKINFAALAEKAMGERGGEIRWNQWLR